MADTDKGIMTALQPIIEMEKIGKRIFATESGKNTDMITHPGFDRVFERRNEVDYPDYHLQQQTKQ